MSESASVPELKTTSENTIPSKTTKSKSKKALSELSTQDMEQVYNMVSNLSSEFFKVVMACLLAIFVPQSCNGDVCTFEDNFSNLTIFNKFVIAYNFFTLGYFLYLYWIEVSREQWFITHFDYNPKESEYHLHVYKEQYPDLFTRMQQKNKHYMSTYKILKYLYVSNFIVSSVLVLHFYYLDYRTITTLITNVILCWSKVMKGYTLASKSYEENIAISYYNILNLSFNMIDEDYMIKNVPTIKQASDVESNEIKEASNQSEIKEIELVMSENKDENV